MAKTQYGRDPKSIKFLALLCPILGRTEEEAQEKFRYYRSLGSIDGALALFGGWTGIDLDQYGDDQELRQVESNAIRSAVEGWSKATPEVPKWTKKTVGEHITVGGLGATAVGTPQKVADIMERWVSEADVDGFNIVSLFPPPSSILRPVTLTYGRFSNETGLRCQTRHVQGRYRSSSPRAASSWSLLGRLCCAWGNISREHLSYAWPDWATPGPSGVEIQVECRC